MNGIVVTNIRRETRAEHIRVVADVSYGNKFLKNESYWIEVPAHLADEVSLSGNPWLRILLPLALTLHQPIQIDAPVDPVLYENIHSAMDKLVQWYPLAKPVKINAPLEPIKASPQRTGTLFSLGIDSFYTVLKNDPPIDDLIVIRHTADEYRGQVKESVLDVARELGKETVFLETNIRQTNWQIVHWSYFGFIPFFMGCLSILENRYQQILTPSMGIRTAVNHHHHPDIDPLWSSSVTQVQNAGTGVSRFEKLEANVASPVFRKHLKICWKSPTGNCGICEKCYRTKVGLELLGLREEMDIFEDDYFTAEGIKNYRIRERNREYYDDMLAVARAQGRDDLAEPMEYLLEKSMSGGSLALLLKNPKIQAWFRQYPLLWNVLRPTVKTILHRL